MGKHRDGCNGFLRKSKNTRASHLCFGRGMRESKVPEPGGIQVRHLKTGTPRSKA